MIKKISFVGVIVLFLVSIGFNLDTQNNNEINTNVNQKSFFVREVTTPVVRSAYVDIKSEDSVVFNWDVYDPSKAVTNILLKDEEDVILLNTTSISGSSLINDFQPHKYNNWHLEVYYKNEAGDTMIVNYEIDTFSLVQNKLWMYVMIGVLAFIIFVIILMYILYRRREKRLLKAILAQEQSEWDRHNYY